MRPESDGDELGKSWPILVSQRVLPGISCHQLLTPSIRQGENREHIEAVMNSRIPRQISGGEHQQRLSRLHAILLKMHEGPGQLNQALEEIPIRPAPILQPQILEHLVRFEEFTSIEADEIAPITQVETARVDSSQQALHFG